MEDIWQINVVSISVRLDDVPVQIEVDTWPDRTSDPQNVRGETPNLYGGGNRSKRITASASLLSSQSAQLRLIIVEGDGPTLLGRDLLQHLRLDWSRLNCVTQEGGMSLKSIKFSFYFVCRRWSGEDQRHVTHSQVPRAVMTFNNEPKAFGI